MNKEYLLGLYEKAVPSELSFFEKLRICKEAGYDFIQLSIDESDQKLARLDMPRQERLGMVQDMYRADIPVGSICLSGHRKYPLGSHCESVCDKALSIMEKCIMLSKYLGAGIVHLAGYDVYYEDSDEQTIDRFEKNLGKAVELAAKYSVVLAFETMETPFMDTVSKTMRWVKRFSSPYLQIYPDIGNLTNAAIKYGHDVADDLKSGEGHIVSLHLKETKPGVYRNLMFGDGHVDFANAVGVCWKLGVRRYVTEFWYNGNPGWKSDVDKASRFALALLDRQGGQ